MLSKVAFGSHLKYFALWPTVRFNRPYSSASRGANIITLKETYSTKTAVPAYSLHSWSGRVKLDSRDRTHNTETYGVDAVSSKSDRFQFHP